MKVYHTFRSRQRSLIVTQSVTNRGWPVSLNEYLHGDPTIVAPALGSLIAQVVGQLDQLGPREHDEVLVGAFLWEHLDRTAMDKTWSACDTRHLETDEFENPLLTFDHLKASRAKHWATRRNCIHGDLNATNVAIDDGAPGQPQAYIFDAAGMRADFEFRDLATLEITSILFNAAGADQNLVDASKPFYTIEFLPTAAVDAAAPPLTRNVLATIHAIRSRFPDEQSRLAYALLLFSAALQQLSGLGFQPSPNKVKNPVHACHLAAWIATWLRSIAPQLFPNPHSDSVLEQPHPHGTQRPGAHTPLPTVP